MEAAGAFLQIPFLLAPSPRAAELSVVGCLCFASGLGLIISTYKRKSPVCWSQLVLTILFLRLAFPPGERRFGIDGFRAVLKACVCAVLSVFVGVYLQQL